MFSWTVLPNETLKLKQKMIYYLYSSQLSLFLLHMLFVLRKRKKKLLNKLKNTLKYNDRA